MKRRSTKLIILLCLLAIGVIIAAFVFLQHLGNVTPDIKLPDGRQDSEASPQPSRDTSVKEEDITADNVLSLLSLLSRADSYCQVYTVNGTQTVTVSHRNDITGVVTDNGRQIRHTILYRDRVYIWYNEETGYYEGLMGEDFSADDVMGIPTYEELLNAETITDAGYEYLDSMEESCIYVKTSEDGVNKSYWISGDTGLLVMFEAVRNGQCIFSMCQTRIQYPVTSEEIFTAAFTLPDGRVLSQQQGQE